MGCNKLVGIERKWVPSNQLIDGEHAEADIHRSRKTFIIAPKLIAPGGDRAREVQGIWRLEAVASAQFRGQVERGGIDDEFHLAGVAKNSS